MKLDSSDWDILLPGTPVKLGNKTLIVKPLGLSDLALLMRELKTVIAKCSDAGITLENYQGNFLQLAEIILTEAPEVLTLLTGVDSDDVKRLPVTIAVELLTACLDANLSSQEELAKNLVASAQKISALVGA